MTATNYKAHLAYGKTYVLSDGRLCEIEADTDDHESVTIKTWGGEVIEVLVSEPTPAHIGNLWIKREFQPEDKSLDQFIYDAESIRPTDTDN